MECPRFKKHSSKIAQVENQTRQKPNKNSAAIATSSNLSRNVISDVTPEQSATIVKRKGAVKISSATNLEKKVSVTAGGEKSDTKSQKFRPGPPPQKNSLYRLDTQLSEVKGDLEEVDNVPEATGLKLAQEKLADSPRSNNNFQKTISKRVDISPEDQLYSSLANLSISSAFEGTKSSDDLPKGFCIPSHGSTIRGRDVEPKLEWFHHPYEGEEIVCHTSDETLESLMNEARQLEREIRLSKPATSSYNDYF